MTCFDSKKAPSVNWFYDFEDYFDGHRVHF